MSNATTKKPRKTKLLPAPLAPLVSKKTNLELSANCLAALARLKANHGMSRTFAIERGVILLEQNQVR